MNNRVLVTYASKAGSTAEVAAKIGETLAQHDLRVDVLPVNKVSDLSQYQSVIVGSAIRVGQFLPEATKFLQSNQTVLQGKPVSVFLTCMTLKDDTEANRQAVSAYLEPVRALVKPVREGMFAGSIDPRRLGFLERMMMKAMKAPEGDFRQWNEIQTWAEDVVVAHADQSTHAA